MVRNDGNESLPNVEIAILFSSDVDANLADFEAGVFSVPNVGACLAETVDILFTALDLAGLADGDYYVGVFVDPDSAIDEADENNNVA